MSDKKPTRPPKKGHTDKVPGRPGPVKDALRKALKLPGKKQKLGIPEGPDWNK